MKTRSINILVNDERSDFTYLRRNTFYYREKPWQDHGHIVYYIICHIIKIVPGIMVRVFSKKKEGKPSYNPWHKNNK